MALRADRRDYKNAFTKHLSAYSNWQATGSKNSKRLILAYCVECGLKCAVMKQEHLYQIDDAQDDVKAELGSHDLRKLLKRLKLAGEFSFPAIKTSHGESVDSGTYHQLCRYCIPTESKYIGAIQQFDSTLEEIAKWIEEHV